MAKGQGDMMEQAVLSFAGMEVKNGVSDKGKPWTLYSFKDSDNRKFNTFSETFGKAIMENLAGPWNVQWNEEQKEYDGNPYTARTIANVGPLEGDVVSAPQPTHEPQGPAPAPGDKERSMALSYAKDLCGAGKIGVDDILAMASVFEDFIVNGAAVASVGSDIPQEAPDF